MLTLLDIIVSVQKRKRQKSASKRRKTSAKREITNNTFLMTPREHMVKTPPELFVDISSEVKKRKKSDVSLFSPRRHSIIRSRPTTQERSLDLRNTSISRASTIRDDFSHFNTPKPIHFNRKKPLHDIKSNRSSNKEKNYYLDDYMPDNIMKNHEYPLYRQSLVKHTRNDRKSLPRTNRRKSIAPLQNIPPMPSFREEPKSKPPNNVDPLYSSHTNFDRLVTCNDSESRPRTSPEILERRPTSSGSEISSKNQVRLKEPDDQLVDLMNILNRSSGKTLKASDIIKGKMGKHDKYKAGESLNLNHSFTNFSLSSSFKTCASNTRAHSATSINPNNVSSSSVKLGNLSSNEGSAVTRRSNSKKTATEPGTRRRKSGKGERKFSGSVLPPVKNKKVKPRCGQCGCRINISNTYSCRCGGMFCSRHRYFETHSCNIDYKAEGRKLLQISNPVVEPQKLPKI